STNSSIFFFLRNLRKGPAAVVVDFFILQISHWLIFFCFNLLRITSLKTTGAVVELCNIVATAGARVSPLQGFIVS
ncbi:hypothetical protein MKW98_020251, partial [Papaver atlanticum]